MLENSLDVIYRLSLETGTYNYVSPSSRQVTGYRPEEAIALGIERARALAHPDDIQRLDENFIQLLTQAPEQGMPQGIEYRIKHKDLGYRWVSDIRSLVYDERNVPVAVVGNLRDITERKRAEEALRESEERYRAFFEQAADSIWLVDATTGTLVEFNDRAHENLGYTRDEFQKLKIPDFEVIESAEDVAKHIEKIVKQGTDTFETKHRTKGGEIQDILVSCRAISVGGRDFIQSMCRDITERKRAEEALLSSEEKLRLMFESVTDGIVLTDLNGVITYANEGAMRIGGFGSKSDMVGRSAIETITAYDRERALADMEQLVERGSVGTEEYTLTRMDGSKYPAEISAGVLKDRAGNLAGFVSVIRDITERKQAEEALRESEAKLDRYMESALDGIYTVDVKGNFLYVNKATQRITGYSRKEMIGKSFVELGVVPPEYLSKGIRMLKRIVSGKPSTAAEFEFVKKDGSRIFVEISSIPIREGDSTEIVAVVRDITERKQAEEEIKASLKEKELLLKEIHHRVKNNLQVVSSLLYLQSEHIKDEQSLATIKESQSRIKSMALVHEQLYQSKGLARVDFAEYIRNLATSLLRSYGVDPDAITLKINAEDVSLGIDTAIPCGLIINELVSNSLEHAFPAGKAGGDRESEIRINLHADDDSNLTLTVSDNGVGLPGDLDFRNTESLGLHLVNTLTRQLEGTIELDRSGGTAFQITFAEP